MIPVFEPEFGESEIEAVVTALRRGELSGSFGESIPEFEERFAAYVGCKHGVAVSSGTTALQLAVAAAGIGSGDEVLMSASTNIATALAALHNGAIPVPVDSESRTWNLDLDLLESGNLISSRTKAVLPVHLYGHPVDMNRLMGIARRYGWIVIEDCAESHGAMCRGQMTGSFGDMGCFSFYANKIITTGEGGMVTTNSDDLARRLRLLRNLAFSTPRFLHEQVGYNFRMTGYQAAFGVAQIKRIEDVIERKRVMARRYSEALSSVRGLRLPIEENWVRHVYWMYGVVVDPEFGISRDELARRLHSDGIETRTFFCPMNLQPCITRVPAYRHVHCPVAETLWEQGLYLPSSQNLEPEAIHQIAEAIKRIQLSAGYQVERGRMDSLK